MYFSYKHIDLESALSCIISDTGKKDSRVKKGGRLLFCGQGLSFSMVPTLAIAGCISRALYKKTGNIWTGAFVNGLLMTIMTVANTTVYFR